MRLSVNVKIISHSVGQGLAPVRKKLHIKSNRRTTLAVVRHRLSRQREPVFSSVFQFDNIS